MPRRTTFLLMFLLAPLHAVAQSITLAEGAANSLTISTVAESSPNAGDTVVLQDAELLAIEITGRYLGQEHDVTRSRRLERSGITRVELPGGGRLLRYRRSAGAFWGFLHVDATGAARVVLEQAGTPLADPFEDRVGVARDGSHFCVPLLAGGLFVVRLDGQDYPSAGAPARLVAPTELVEPLSVMVGEQFVWFQTELQRVYRCGLGDGDLPVDVSPAPQPNAILKDQMAMSGDGSHVVFLYGPQNQQQLFLAGPAGVAAPLPPAPSKYEEPDYLPEGTGSRALLLDEDGSRLFFIDADVRDESYLLDVDGVLPTLHVTADAVFQPYIGVHILPAFLGGKLTVAIGDPNRMDWFRAELTSAGGIVSNLTQTGSALQPFPEGTIDPTDAARVDGLAITLEQTPTAMRLRRIDLGTGAQVVMHQDVVGMPVRGSGLSGQADLVVPTAGGDRLYVDASLPPLFAVPFGLRLTPPARGPLFSALQLDLQNGFSVAAIYLDDGQFVLGPLEAGLDQFCLTGLGGAVAVGDPVRYLAPGVFVVLNRPAVAFRRCLSGAGA